MSTDEMKRRIVDEPFRPFTMYLPSGDTYTVYSRDQILLLGDGRTLVAPDEHDGTSRYFDIPMIERIETRSEKSRDRMWWIKRNGH